MPGFRFKLLVVKLEEYSHVSPKFLMEVWYGAGSPRPGTTYTWWLDSMSAIEQ
jgi:hypothetical protein